MTDYEQCQSQYGVQSFYFNADLCILVDKIIAMLRILFLLLLIVHGLIHFLGFVKAFNLAPVQQLTNSISKFNGILWLLSALLVIIAAFFFFLNCWYWWLLAVVGVILSQYLIITAWSDAKVGIVANIIVLLVAVAGAAAWNFNEKYKQDVRRGMNECHEQQSLLTENDIELLPSVVQQYIRYTGSLNKPKIESFQVEFKGRIRKEEKSGWMQFTSEQHNFVKAAKRFFFMKAIMKGLPVAGYHRYINGDASMDIRLFSIFRVQYQDGPQIDTAETVTLLNDMCCMAPATLIDKRIKWEQADSGKVKAVFTNNGISVTAWLYFNDKGELVNFTSEDRYADMGDGTMKRLRWSTPLGKYKMINGYMLPTFAKTIYAYPEGDFCYGEFETVNVTYNTGTK